jgi:hypothetical protein
LNAISKWRTVLGSLILSVTATAQTVQPVLQRGYDAGVSGATLTETALNTSNVGPNTFGLVFKLPVDDAIFAQPLYVPNVVIPSQGTHNVLYVATMSDTLYAFDADNGGVPLWSKNFASLVGAMPVPIAQFAFQGDKNIVGNLGILSTPVIDPSSNILYLVACTLENGTLAYRLHAVDITSGAEPYGPGVLISGSYGGSTFDARYQFQRVSLALSGNQVVFAFSALQNEMANAYVGWVMAYNKGTLQQSGIFATVTTGNRGGGVWQSGRPAPVDSSGYAYLFTGNAWGGGYDGVHDFSESVLKFDPANGLALLDWFTPSDWSNLDNGDLDLSCSGPMLIPGTSLLAGGGKAAEFYLLNTASLGKYNANDSQIVQKENITNGGMIQGGPVYWQRSVANGGPLLYDWGATDAVKAYAFNGSTLGTSPSAQGSGSQIWPGGILALSANGEQSGSGVLWATVVTSGDASENPPVPGALHAFNAENVAQELWNSTTNAARDGFGNFAKFVPPLVANGRVYVATWSNQVAVYGLLPGYTVSATSAAFGNEQINVPSAPMSVTVTNTGSASLPITSITLSTPSPNPFSQTNTCGSSLAAGAQCSISVVFTPLLAGSTTSTLSINAGGGAGTQTVALSGTGIVPTYTVSAASLAFGSQMMNVASAPMSVTVSNTGTLPLPITSITLSTPSPNPFSQTNTCGSSLAAGAHCSISVVFTPLLAGSTTSTLSINASGGAGTKTVALSGTGAVPTYTVSPASVPFGSQMVNVASAPMSVTVSNTGTLPLPITSITLSTPSPNPFSQTNTCGSSLAAGAHCSISVVFTPLLAGSTTSTLSINAGGGAGTQTVALSGTGAVPTYTVSPASVPFGSQMVNDASAPISVTVSNTGTLPLPLGSIATSAASPNPFSQTNTCGSSLAAGAQCSISVVFTPLLAGSTTSTLSINAGGAGTQTVALSGTGVVPTYTVSPASLPFGSQMMNAASAPMSVTVSNGGTLPLPLGSIATSAASPNPFSQTNTCGTSLAAAANCTVSVVFNPNQAGTATGTLSITVNGAVSTLNLSGSGTFQVTLSASASSVTTGVPITLTWSSPPAATCMASGGGSGDNWNGTLAASGSQSVSEASAATYNYALNCVAQGISASATASVAVTQASAASPPSSKGGGGAFDTISLLSLLTMIGLRERRRCKRLTGGAAGVKASSPWRLGRIW